MNSERQRSPGDPSRQGSTDHEEPREEQAPRSSIVPVQDAEDPFVRAFGGGDRESLPPRQEPKELSPESLAILLDRLDGIVEDNDGAQGKGLGFAPAAPMRSGIMARGRRRFGLRTGLAIAAGLLAAGIAVLLWPAAPERGHVVRHAVDGWGTDVRTVDLPAAPAPVVEALPTPQPSEATEGATPPAPAPKGRLHVNSDHGSAQVFLHGRSLGRVPGELQLRPGRHHLLFRSSEGLSYYRTVRVRSGETVELTLP